MTIMTKTLRGIPYGFVFKELSDELDEEWTVTLSHEAMELIADPESNLYVLGPHPKNPKRTCLHWYEMCDAVQARPTRSMTSKSRELCDAALLYEQPPKREDATIS
jgi:hypothetical protein